MPFPPPCLFHSPFSFFLSRFTRFVPGLELLMFQRAHDTLLRQGSTTQTIPSPCSYHLGNCISVSFFHMPHQPCFPVNSTLISSVFAVENIAISGLNRVLISQGKTSRLSRSTRNSKSCAMFNKTTLCSLYFVKFVLVTVFPAFTNFKPSFRTTLVSLLFA